MTDQSKKRKIDVEDGFDPSSEKEFELLANFVNNYIQNSVSRFERLEEEIRILKQKVNEHSNVITSNEWPKQDLDEDVSDDEESVVEEGDQWTKNFRLLRTYRHENGHCNVSKSENGRLYSWIANQRTAFRMAKTGNGGRKPLSNEQIVKLDSIGFFWGKNYPTPSWEEMFERLKNYKDRIGNCNVPLNPTNPTPLAKWVGFQRKEFKRYKYGRPHIITPDQIGMLKDIGFSFKGPTL